MTAIPRVIFMGTPDFAVPSLRALIDSPHFDVVGLVCQPDRRSGRGRKVQPPPTKALAVERNVDVFQPLKVKTDETHARIAAWNPDVAIVAAYGRILPKRLLDLPRHGCLNVHASLLPRHRGASPIAHAIMEGDESTGVTLMRMDEGLDTGPTYSRIEIAIAGDATTESLTKHLAELGAELVERDLRAVLDGSLEAKPQPEGASYAPLLSKDDGLLDFASDAGVLERRIRGLFPWPAAYFQTENGPVQVGRGHVGSGSGVAGTVLSADKRGVEIACGVGSLWLDEVKPPGKRMMPSSAWVTGRAITPGSRIA